MFLYIITSFLIFVISLTGIFLFQKHLINVLISLELTLLSINFNFIVFSYYIDDILGQIYGLLIFTVGATEASIGLSLLVIYYKTRGGISLDHLNLLKT